MAPNNYAPYGAMVSEGLISEAIGTSWGNEDDNIQVFGNLLVYHFINAT